MDQIQFYLMATRLTDETGFSFPQEQITLQTFPDITLAKDDSNKQCLTGLANATSHLLDLRPTDCQEQHAVICRKVMMSKPGCLEKLEGSLLDLLLSPDNRGPLRRAAAFRKAEMVALHERLHFNQAFSSLFEALWYSNLPCTEKYSNFYSSGAFLRYCEWKGLEVPCGSIFSAFPTDSGICCSFNMGAAEEIYQESDFSKALSSMQRKDKLDMVDSEVPGNQGDTSETSAGVGSGLVLLLDTRSDQVSVATRDNPDNALATVFVGSPGNFPLVNNEGIEVLAGRGNSITVTSTKVDADDTVSMMEVADRNCYFPEENSLMMVFRKYSNWNCKVECVLSYALDQMKDLYGASCTPWFIPKIDDGIRTCDAWQSSYFMKLFRAKSSENFCSHCLPDCSSQIFEATSSSSSPFADCDLNNAGGETFCDLNSGEPMSEKFSTMIKTNFQMMNNTIEANLPYISSLDSSLRSTNKDIVYVKAPGSALKTYDAFDEDIALLEIVFDTSTMFVYQSSSTENWVNYLADVGGLLGIVLGMGFISFIEVIWVIVRLLSAWFGCKNWVS